MAVGPSGLIRDQAGNLYGTTATGGNGAGCIGGCGIIFKLNPAGQQAILYNFAGTRDGAFPLASLVRDSAGNLYGTTFDAGTFGFGTVFRLNPNGTLRVLHSFRGSDGANSGAELLADQQGNLYGTTESGGTGSCQGGCGVVFQLTANGNETVLHSFMGGADGIQPTAGLVADAGGTSIWGTTYQGGVDNQGIVFELHN